MIDFPVKQRGSIVLFSLLTIALASMILLLSLGHHHSRTQVEDKLKQSHSDYLLRTIFESALLHFALESMEKGQNPGTKDFQEALDQSGIFFSEFEWQQNPGNLPFFWGEVVSMETDLKDWVWGHRLLELSLIGPSITEVVHGLKPFIDVEYQLTHFGLFRTQDHGASVDLIEKPFFRPYLHAYGLAGLGLVPRNVPLGMTSWFHQTELSARTQSAHQELLQSRGLDNRVLLLFEGNSRERVADHYFHRIVYSWLFPQRMLTREFQDEIETLGPIWSFGTLGDNPEIQGLAYNELNGVLTICLTELEPEVLTIADPLGGSEVILLGKLHYEDPELNSEHLISFRSFHDTPTTVTFAENYFLGITLLGTHTRFVSPQPIQSGAVPGGFFGNIFLHPYSSLEGNLALQGGLAFYWMNPPENLHLDVPLSGNKHVYRDLAWSPVVHLPAIRKKP